MERKRWECSALPQGWKKEEVTRRSGLSAGKSDVYYYREAGQSRPLQRVGGEGACPASKSRLLRFSPSGKKFRSKPQLARYLGNSMDLSTFDFRTGKMLMSKLNKNRQRMRYDGLNQAKLFWEKKLSGLNAFDIAEELVKTMDLPKGLQGVGPGCTDETLLSAIASALHTSTMPITGQLSAAVEKNPGVWLNTSQPLCKAFMVTDEDIRKQEELVQQVRKKLEEALMADMLAHVEEISKDGGAPLDKDLEDDEEEEDQREQGTEDMPVTEPSSFQLHETANSTPGAEP
ncbi:hypothetical protein FKM82_028315 [Ascaphus truei]